MVALGGPIASRPSHLAGLRLPALRLELCYAGIDRRGIFLSPG